MNNNFSGLILLLVAILLVLSFSAVQGHSETMLRQPVNMFASVAASSCTPYYVVRSGDTLSVIAGRCGVSTVGLAQANGLRLTSLIFPGQRLIMPGAATSSSTTGTTGLSGAQASTGCPARYIVRAGDTLGAIAYRCAVSVTSLKQWNNLRSDLIWIDQVLIIRSTGSFTTPAPTATPTVSVTPRSTSGLYAVSTPTPYWNPAVQPILFPTATPAIESTVSAW